MEWRKGVLVTQGENREKRQEEDRRSTAKMEIRKAHKSYAEVVRRGESIEEQSKEE